MTKLGDIMRRGFLFTVQADAMVAEAVHLMTVYDVGIVSVLSGERLVGVFSERDAVQRVMERGLDPHSTPVGEVTTRNVIVADVEDDYRAALRTMDRAGIRHLPVAAEGRVLSMISIRDLIRVDMQGKDEELRYLREYLYQVPAGAPWAP